MKKLASSLTAFVCYATLFYAYSAPAVASPFADAVVQYVEGIGFADGYDNPSSALGEPTRFTSPASQFGGAVTPFNSPFGADEVVSIGEGGYLVVQFAEPILDDPRNPFGIDLLIFGNSFQALGGGVFAEGGVVEVSADGVEFFVVPGVDADGAFPTLGYQDLTEPFPSVAGAVLTDFTRPVDPHLDPTGLDIIDVSLAYGGSGGGAGVDLAAVGLSEASFVRISNPDGSGITPEIDALADVSPVPEPATFTGAMTFVFVAATQALRRRRRQAIA